LVVDEKSASFESAEMIFGLRIGSGADTSESH
jgi:hypothetical protein